MEKKALPAPEFSINCFPTTIEDKPNPAPKILASCQKFCLSVECFIKKDLKSLVEKIDIITIRIRIHENCPPFLNANTSYLKAINFLKNRFQLLNAIDPVNNKNCCNFLKKSKVRFLPTVFCKCAKS